MLDKISFFLPKSLVRNLAKEDISIKEQFCPFFMSEKRFRIVIARRLSIIIHCGLKEASLKEIKLREKKIRRNHN